MTTKTPAEYVANKGACCPVCGCTELDGQSVTIDSGKAYQPIFCTDCDAQWIDEYALTGYTELEAPEQGEE